MSWHIFAPGHSDNFSFKIYLYKSLQHINTLAGTLIDMLFKYTHEDAGMDNI